MTHTAIPLLLHLGAAPAHWPADLAAQVSSGRLRISAAADMYTLAAACLSASDSVAAILIDPRMVSPNDARSLEWFHASAGIPIFFLEGPPTAAITRLLPSATPWPAGKLEELGDMHKNGSARPAPSLDADAPSRYDDSSHVMLTDEEVRALLGSPD